MEFIDSWNALSSTGLASWFFDFIELAGKWAESASELLGLL